MGRNDDFWDLVERGRKRLGFDDPLPKPPRPLQRPEQRRLGHSDQQRVSVRKSMSVEPDESEQPIRQSHHDDFQQAEAVAGRRKPADEESIFSGDGEIDRLIDQAEGRIAPTAEFEQQRRDKGCDDTREWVWRFWRYEGFNGLKDIAKDDLQRAKLVLDALARIANDEDDFWRKRKMRYIFDILDDVVEHATPHADLSSRVPLDLWSRIKQGEARSDLVWFLAQPLLEETREPGMSWYISVDREIGRFLFGRGEEFFGDWFERKNWEVWNFRNWDDLREFEQRINWALRAFMLGKVEMGTLWGVKEAMYWEDHVEQIMHIYHYIPGSGGQWIPHPGVVSDEPSSLDDPPFITCKSVAMFFSDPGWAWYFAESEGKPIPPELLAEFSTKEAMFEHFGNWYALIKAKQGILETIDLLGEGLLVFGL